MNPRPALALLLLTLATFAHATDIGTTTGARTVYRCGPEGRSYSQEPCPQGRTVDVADERTPQQQAQARTEAGRAQALTDRMARERQQREASLRPAAAVTIHGERGVTVGQKESVLDRGTKKTSGPKERRRGKDPAKPRKPSNGAEPSQAPA